MLIYLRNILQLILSPTKGWEDVSADGGDPQWLMRHCMFVLMSLAALSVFVQGLYIESPGMMALVEMAMVVFASLFASFFFGSIMLRTFLYRFCEGETNDTKCQTVAVYMAGLVSLSQILINAMPVDVGLTFLLPLCLAMIVWKSDLYLCVIKERSFYYALFGFVVMILPPFLLIAFFNMLIH